MRDHTRGIRTAALALVIGLLLGGAVMSVTPAGASVQQSVATNWKKIWKKNLKPQADKRYYTKKQSDSNYARAGSGYTKAESDAKYAGAGSGYTKAESDAKYAPAVTQVRGVFAMRYTATAAGQDSGADISFGVTLPQAPTVRVIQLDAALPVGCSGTPIEPVAAPGYLCVFERFRTNQEEAVVMRINGAAGAERFGAYVGSQSLAVGSARLVGSWALGVA